VIHQALTFVFVETMAKKRMTNGYRLRGRSVPPRVYGSQVVPSSLMNINEPAKSKRLMKRFVKKLKDARKVISYAC